MANHSDQLLPFVSPFYTVHTQGALLPLIVLPRNFAFFALGSNCNIGLARSPLGYCLYLYKRKAMPSIGAQ